MDNILSYYSILKLLHVIGMSAWFGTALTISIIWSKQDKTDLKLILDLISKVEMPASFFIPLTGILMMIEKTYFLQLGWMHLKILIALFAIAFTHMSRAHLIHSDLNDINILQKFIFYRNLSLAALIIILIIVGYK